MAKEAEVERNKSILGKIGRELPATEGG